MATILVVDDEKPLRELVRAYLESEGHRVLEAAAGQSALQQFAENKPDVVILDLMLPEIDGVEICRRLRTQSDVYIIMLTARAYAPLSSPSPPRCSSPARPAPPSPGPTRGAGRRSPPTRLPRASAR